MGEGRTGGQTDRNKVVAIGIELKGLSLKETGWQADGTVCR